MAKSKGINVSLVIVGSLLAVLPISSVGAEDLESQYEQEAETSEDSDNLERLHFLEKHPLDLNRATAGELSSLPYLSAEEASAIIAYRDKTAGFKTVEDIQKVPGFSAEKVHLLRPYLTLRALSPPALHAVATLKFKRQTPKSFGFSAPDDSSRYRGNSLFLHSSIQVTYGESYRLVIGTSKAPGEENYVDAVVAGGEWQATRGRLLLGNYVLGFARGLAFGRPHGFSRFSGRITPSEQTVRSPRLFQANAPASAFLGLAGEIRQGAFVLTAFGSRQALDATRDPITGEVRTITNDGDHRSLSEKSKRNALREEMAGGRIGYDSGGRITLGMTGYCSRDKPPLSPEWNERRIYDFRGERNSILAGDIELSLGPVRVLSEAAQSYCGGNAAVLGGIWSLPPWSFSLTAWHYDPDFNNRYAYGACHSEPRNEAGALAMGRGILLSRTRLFGYYEEYRHPWRRYYEAFPTAGAELGGEISQALGKSLEVTLRRKVSLSEKNGAQDGNTSYLLSSTRNVTRYEGLWHASPATSLRLRFEQVRSDIGGKVGRGTSLGFTVRQRIGKTWRLASSLAVFHTDSYDSRLYQWEEDLPGILTNTVLYGRGRRTMLYLEGSPLRSLACSLLYSNAYYYQQTAMGTGLDARPGNFAQEFGLALTTSR